jgi:hypothetical protein
VHLYTGLEAIPGALAGMGVVWWIGSRQLGDQEPVHY